MSVSFSQKTRVVTWLCLLILIEAVVARALQLTVESVVPPAAHAQLTEIPTIADCDALDNIYIDTTLTDAEIADIRAQSCFSTVANSRGTCPAMDNFVNTRLTVQQLRDEQARLCPWILSDP